MVEHLYMLKEKPRILYLAKMFYMNEGKKRHFQIKKKRNSCHHTSTIRNTKEVLQAEGK